MGNKDHFWKRSYVRFIVLTCLSGFLLVLPDILLALCEESFSMFWDPKALLFLLPLAVGFVCAPNFFSAFILIFFSILEVVQFAHIKYFGVRLTPFALHLAQSNMDDVASEVVNLWPHYLFILPIVILPFLSIYLINKKFWTKKSWIGILSIGGLLFFLAHRLYSTTTPRFLPNARRITIDSSLKAFYGYFIVKYRHYKIHNYEPYIITENEYFKSEKPCNIVYIIGESCNYRHMSLFGYDVHDTTPRLRELAKGKDFYYTVGISGANSTAASTKFIANVLREPNNLIQMTSEKTNLFNLAKKSGFTTFYLSTQTDFLLASIGGFASIDYFMTRDTSPLQVLVKRDLYLHELIKEHRQHYGNKNLIVLHQYSVHAPYKKTYGAGYEAETVFSGQKNSLFDEYDNAMLYNDYLISEIFNFFNKSDDPYYIIWASDHNELLGEHGMWGHASGNLVPEASYIPVLIQTNDSEFLDKFKSIPYITHYEIAKLLAQRIGFDILNPNEEKEPNVFFTDGPDYTGKCGYFRFVKDLKNRTVTFDPPTYL